MKCLEPAQGWYVTGTCEVGYLGVSSGRQTQFEKCPEALEGQYMATECSSGSSSVLGKASSIIDCRLGYYCPRNSTSEELFRFLGF